MKAIALLAVLVLPGCGATPVFLGDETDGAAFYARITEFRADVEESRILHALGASHEVKAAGCQLSMRGEVPRGTVAVLHAGDCQADITHPSDVESEFGFEFNDAPLGVGPLGTTTR